MAAGASGGGQQTGYWSCSSFGSGTAEAVMRLSQCRCEQVHIHKQNMCHGTFWAISRPCELGLLGLHDKI